MSDGWSGGSFSVSVDMSANAAAGIDIVASAFSNQMDVVVTGINNCVAKDGQNAATGNLPMGGFRHTGTGKAAAVDSYSRVNEFIHLSPLYMLDNEAAGSITVSCTATPWATGLSAGMHVYVRAAGNKPFSTGGNVVIKINGLSANCSANDGSQLWPGAFTSGQIHELVYDGSNFKLLNPGYRVVTGTFKVEAREAGGGVTTASVTTSMSCEMYRDNNIAYLTMAESGRHRTTWQTSAANTIYLSALPSWMRPATVTKFGPGIFYCSASTERFGSINVSADGRVLFRTAGNGGNFDTDATIFPFQITYSVK